MTVWIGIDPGLTGAVAYYEAGYWHVHDIPVRATEGGLVDREVDAEALTALLAPMRAEHGHLACLERTHAMPKQGVSTMFSMGDTRGAIRGVLGALGMPYRQAQPQIWKAHFQLIGAQKDASVARCLGFFPYLAPHLKLKKHHNRAEAVLIGQWLMDVTPR